VVLAAKGDEAIEQHPEQPLALLGGRHERVAHHAVFHLPPPLRELRELLDFGAELHPPRVLHGAVHVDQLAPQVELQARLPLAAVTDAALVVLLAPRLQLVAPWSSR